MSETSTSVQDLPMNGGLHSEQRVVQSIPNQFHSNVQNEVQNHLNQGDNITIQVKENSFQPFSQTNVNNMNVQNVPTQNQQQPYINQQNQYINTQNTNPSQNQQQQYVNQQNQQVNAQNTNPSQNQVQGLNDMEMNMMMQAIRKPNTTQLPSRDISMSQTQQTLDIQSHPNFVPEQMKNTPSKSVRFVEEHQEQLHNTELQHQKERNITTIFETILDQIHIPIILSILYFIFQLPFFNERLFKQMPFLFVKEHRLSLYGIIIKAVLFSCSYMGVHQILAYVSE